MIPKNRDRIRQIGAFFVATCLIWPFAVPSLASGPFDLSHTSVIIVFYLVFIVMTCWFFSNDPTGSRHAFEVVRAGWAISKWIVLVLAVSQAIAISFWALSVYVLDSKLYITQYERNDELPVFLTIGAIAGSAVAFFGAFFGATFGKK